MMANVEEGLVQQYVSEIQALTVKAYHGEDVKTRVQDSVAQAVAHFNIIVGSDPKANVAAYRGRLKLYADLTHESQPAVRETLLYAASVCPESV
ncbi:hypothetical protein FIV41_25785 [Pseudomonas marginalis]|uniref:Uncharacterized protein n=1 Tax=Pseudomonas marginalis TaxID=298 RepID=A0A9X9BMI1_PSEMA|nr:hypothetical protein [Pseudomonas marginalis]TWR52502.1 hypothetical protein FIV41_25785 [Pseudomonas marginalis]